MSKIILKNRNIYVIMFHHIQEKKSSLFPNLKSLEFNNFKKQINFLKSKTNILNNNQFFNILKTKKFPQKPSVILTFDDGYIEHYNYVFPFLFDNKISGFFYPPIKTTENKIVLDVNKIHLILAKEKNKKKIINLIFYFLKKLFSISPDNLKLDKIKLTSRFDDKDTMLIKTLLQHHLPFKHRRRVLDEIFFKILRLNEAELAKKIYMGKQHIIEMSQNSMIFGSHGYNHYWWEFLSLKDQEKELKNSINYFKKIKLFNERFSVCYPFGSHNNDTIKLLKKYRIAFAFTSKPGSINRRNFGKKFNFPRYDTNDL